MERMTLRERDVGKMLALQQEEDEKEEAGREERRKLQAQRDESSQCRGWIGKSGRREEGERGCNWEKFAAHTQIFADDWLVLIVFPC